MAYNNHAIFCKKQHDIIGLTKEKQRYIIKTKRD